MPRLICWALALNIQKPFRVSIQNIQCRDYLARCMGSLRCTCLHVSSRLGFMRDSQSTCEFRSLLTPNGRWCVPWRPRFVDEAAKALRDICWSVGRSTTFPAGTAVAERGKRRERMGVATHLVSSCVTHVAFVFVKVLYVIRFHLERSMTFDLSLSLYSVLYSLICCLRSWISV